MSDLSELVEPLKRAVATPGTFADVFPEATDDLLTAQLADAFGEAQLDGFLSGFSVDLTLSTTSPDLSTAQGALLVVYAAYTILVNEVRNRKSHVRYEASGTVFEQDQTASMLNEILRQLGDRKKDLLEQARLGQLDETGVFMADLAFVKATQDYGWNSNLSLREYEGL